MYEVEPEAASDIALGALFVAVAVGALTIAMLTIYRMLTLRRISTKWAVFPAIGAVIHS